MPTYEYRCSECGQHVEVVQSFSAEPLTVCGACRGPLKKVFGSIGIIFKGSGIGDAPEVAESYGSSGKAAERDADTPELGRPIKPSRRGGNHNEVARSHLAAPSSS